MKMYATAFVAIWCVPVGALVLLFTVGGVLTELPLPFVEEVFWVLYFALFLGAPVAAVLTLLVMPIIALVQWSERAERRDG